MKKIVYLLSSIALFSLAVSCKKPEGCTDPLSSKYDKEAEKDNGSCTYNGRTTFWFNYATATNLVNAGIPNVDIYVDGVQEGSVSMTKASAGAPACAGNDGFTATVDLGLSKSSQKSYSIYKGGTMNIIQSGYVQVEAASCSWVQLNY